MTGEEIRSNLLRLAARWAGYRGTERAGAQPFLEGLFAAYGVDRMDVGAEFEVHQEDGGFADLPDLHTELDRAVTRAYGWDVGLSDSPLELRVKLAERHAAIVAGDIDYAPFDGWH